MKLKHYTKQEIIDGLRKALKWYAIPENHLREAREDMCQDDCSGFYLQYGEIARQALNQYHESTTIVR